MDELILKLMKIKKKKKLSYEGIARQLNVSFNSVWRWCQGRTVPFPAVKDKIKDFIKHNS